MLTGPEAREWPSVREWSLRIWTLLLGLAVVGSAMATCTDPPGDVNGDGDVSIVDTQCALLVAVWELAGSIPADTPQCIGTELDRADLDCDNAVTVGDVILTIRLALDIGVPEESDANGNNCVDACDEPVISTCCAPTGEPGCDSPTCADCVCGADSFCCDVEWDVACATSAGFDCDGACECPLSDADCCNPHDGVACEDPVCAASVCGADSYCCEVNWDQSCAECAVTGTGFEGLDCTGPSGNCECGPLAACCGLAGGCQMLNEAACEHVNGSFSPGATCADADASGAADICEPPAGSCPFAGGPCTSANGTPGCNNTACCEAVCATDSYCCEFAWDDVCATMAIELCTAPEACCGDFGCSLLSPAQCLGAGGSPVAGATCDDTDGFGGPDACGPPTFACCLPTGCEMMVSDECNSLGGTFFGGQSCEDADGSGQPDVCESWACCSEAGCTMTPLAPCIIGGGVPHPGFNCADNDGDGSADICEGAGCCADLSPAAGCDANSPCASCVCDEDPFCCATSWDALCGLCASGDFCGSPPSPSTVCALACGCSASQPARACCLADGCAMLTATECEVLGGGIASAFGCSDGDGDGEGDVCEAHACCVKDGCIKANLPTCVAAGGDYVFGDSCQDTDDSGAADACE